MVTLCVSPYSVWTVVLTSHMTRKQTFLPRHPPPLYGNTEDVTPRGGHRTEPPKAPAPHTLTRRPRSEAVSDMEGPATNKTDKTLLRGYKKPEQIGWFVAVCVIPPLYSL